jgi:ABC-type dipeptide/oligopeptide/nickel transport system permease subunit
MSTPTEPASHSPASVPAIPAIMAPRAPRRNAFWRSRSGLIGLGVLVIMFAACLGSLPWTLATVPGTDGSAGTARYNSGDARFARTPPAWWAAVRPGVWGTPASADEGSGVLSGQPGDTSDGTEQAAATHSRPVFVLGSDALGRSLLVRVLAGGGISLSIGLAAALISVAIGTLYGALAGYLGGRVDAVLMRIVDVLYGLPYILLVVLLAVASNAMVDEYVSRSRERAGFVEAQARAALLEDVRSGVARDASARAARELVRSEDPRVASWREAAFAAHPPREMPEWRRRALDVVTLLVAIAAVSWLTLARVIRGQVLSLKNQPFVEAARAMGAGPVRVFALHLLPNLLGPVIVYATLAVPQAILQESFLSFLGIGVKPPLPSWGNLAADGLSELNIVRSHWWLLVFPCLLLGVTLLALNFVGEGLREAFDPRRSRA